MQIGYALSSEDHGPKDLVAIAVAAEQAGFRSAWISDHYHPWVGQQGNSPFVWSVLGGIATATGLRVGTGVTCPTVRIHPAVVAQAAATTALMFDGRFYLGVGSGEALNEHIFGDAWPHTDVRLEMLEEAVEVMRKLWTGDVVNHHGTHYTVDHARLYTLPDQPPPVYVSGFGPKATELAARIGDGFCGASPEGELVQQFIRQADGGEGKPRIAGAKCCWDPDETTARRRVLERWPNMGVPGELAQVLPYPEHFEQAAQLVTEEMVADPIPCGPDPEQYVASMRQYAEAGYTEVCIQNIGEDWDAFFRFWSSEVRPRLDI